MTHLSPLPAATLSGCDFRTESPSDTLARSPFHPWFRRARVKKAKRKQIRKTKWAYFCEFHVPQLLFALDLTRHLIIYYVR